MYSINNSSITIRSVRALTSNVVIAVCTAKDAAFIEDLAMTRFYPALLAAGAPANIPVLTLLTFELQSPQSLPVAAVGVYVRTVNKVGVEKHDCQLFCVVALNHYFNFSTPNTNVAH